MSIGKSFEEIMQKGLRMIGQGMHGFVGNNDIHFDNLDESGEPYRLAYLRRGADLGTEIA